MEITPWDDNEDESDRPQEEVKPVEPSNLRRLVFLAIPVLALAAIALFASSKGEDRCSGVEGWYVDWLVLNSDYVELQREITSSMEANTATMDEVRAALRSMNQIAQIQSMTSPPPAAKSLNDLWVGRVQRNVSSSRALLDGNMSDSEWEASIARDSSDFAQIQKLHQELRDECSLH